MRILKARPSATSATVSADGEHVKIIPDFAQKAAKATVEC